MFVLGAENRNIEELLNKILIILNNRSTKKDFEIQAGVGAHKEEYNLNPTVDYTYGLIRAFEIKKNNFSLTIQIRRNVNELWMDLEKPVIKMVIFLEKEGRVKEGINSLFTMESKEIKRVLELEKLMILYHQEQEEAGSKGLKIKKFLEDLY
jgi:hypothetical protein